MKICFFSENGHTGKLPRNFHNCRTEFAWQIALNADHIPLSKIITEHHREFDIGIVILPKKNTADFVAENIENIIRKWCKKIAYMQEGPHDFFEDMPVNIQFRIFELYSNADFLLCHNEWDISYYTGIYNKKTYCLPSLIISDNIDNKLNSLSRTNVIIGGNLCKWYGGFPSFVVAMEFGCPIYAPSMGRRVDNEDLVGLNHLTYMSWTNWMMKLNEFKYAVHLMPTVAAGTFSLNCAALGIPCIGFDTLDTQRKCFPKTSVMTGDIQHAVNVAKELKNESFYQDVSRTALNNYKKYFSEEVFCKKMFGIFKNELSCDL